MMLLPNPRDDTGKMFGALSMLQAISATIVSVNFSYILLSIARDGYLISLLHVASLFRATVQQHS